MIKQKLTFKKIIYLILSVILGQLLSFFAFELAANLFIKAQEAKGRLIDFSYVLGVIFIPLPHYIFWLFIIAGSIGGFFLGRTWWRIIYVEHRRFKNWHKK